MDEDERLDSAIDGVPEDGYVDTSELWDRWREINEPSEDSLERFRIDSRTLWEDLTATEISMDIRPFMDLDDEIYNLPEVPLGVQTPPVIHHGERINFDWIRETDWTVSDEISSLYSRSLPIGQDELIKDFNKKCENCDKEECEQCMVINCFIDHLFENFTVKRK